MLLILAFLFISIFQASSQSDSIRCFIFGHSLLDHRPPAIPTPSDETTVPHWIYLFAQYAGKGFAAGGKYGFLPQHADNPPFSQWGYDIVPPVWDSDNETFKEANIDRVIITAANFMQWAGPDRPYPGNPGRYSPISASEVIIDWLVENGAPKISIYENWPDMSTFLNGGTFPPNETQWDAYWDHTRGHFHDWWITYQDSLISSRRAVNIRMIPVGPILEKLIHNGPLENIPITDLFEDDAPHGRPNIYFLAAMITYMGIFEEKIPDGYEAPQLIHPTIADNFDALSEIIWQDLILFNDPKGKSRVFCPTTTATAEVKDHSKAPTVFPNPVSQQLHWKNADGFTKFRLFNSNGQVQAVQEIGPAGKMEIEHLPPGFYIIEWIKNEPGKVYSKLIIR